MTDTFTKAERLLRCYLKSQSEMEDRNERIVFPLIVEEFLERMKCPSYFNAVQSFIERSPREPEEEAFFFLVVSGIVKTGHIREKIKERYPGVCA